MRFTIDAMSVAYIGDRTEWKDFGERNAKFLEKLPSLEQAVKLAFERSVVMSETNDRVIFYSGRLCAEDFFEILVLVGNGYGFGGIKLLRGMFEKLVTAIHLHVNPEETDAFMNFYWVAKYRLIRQLIDSFGETGPWAKDLEFVQPQYDLVQKDYRVPHCEHCEKTRLNHTWSRMDVLTMAKKSGGDELVKLAFDAYAMPTQYAHSTVLAIVSRVSGTPDGTVFEGGAQRDKSDRALMMAHHLLIITLALQADHFSVDGLQAAVTTCGDDFNYVWKGRFDAAVAG